MPTIKQRVADTQKLAANPNETWGKVQEPSGTSVSGVSPIGPIQSATILPIRAVYPSQFVTAADFQDSADQPGIFRTRVLQWPVGLVKTK